MKVTIESVAEGYTELCIEFSEIDKSHRNIIKAILDNPEVIDDSDSNTYEANVFYQGKMVAVKQSKNCKVCKVTATYWKHRSIQDNGDDVR